MRENYVLQQQDFDSLLGLFSGDKEEAGRMYEKQRCGLIRYFLFKGCSNPQDLADETLNRVASRVSSYDPAKQATPSTYIYGFALNILREYQRGAGVRETQLDPVHLSGSSNDASDADDAEMTAVCLHECLGGLRSNDRDMIVEYYSRSRQEKIDLRRRMAERLGCRPEVLYTRAFRIKSVLRECVEKCRKKNL